MFKDLPQQAPEHSPSLDDALRREAVHYARVLGCAPDEAEDATQEACIALWRRGLLVEQPAPLMRAALRAAVRFRVLELRRQVARDRSVQDEQWANAVDRAWREVGIEHDHDRWLDALRACRGRLRGKMQQVANWFYDEQMPRSEVASRLGMKETGVKTLLQRLRAALRQCMQRRMR